MKIKNLLPIIISAISTIVLLVMACTQVAAPQTPSSTPTQQPTATISTPTVSTPTVTTVEVDKKYNVLDPTGIFLPVQTKALAPRLDTIDGKTIYVVQGEADAVIMPALIDTLKKNYPKTNWVFYSPRRHWTNRARCYDEGRCQSCNSW